MVKSIKTASVPQFKSQLGLRDSCCFPFKFKSFVSFPCFRPTRFSLLTVRNQCGEGHQFILPCDWFSVLGRGRLGGGAQR